jgi:hypothetical protein
MGIDMPLDGTTWSKVTSELLDVRTSAPLLNGVVMMVAFLIVTTLLMKASAVLIALMTLRHFSERLPSDGHKIRHGSLGPFVDDRKRVARE